MIFGVDRTQLVLFYSWGGDDHSENNFLVFVKKGKVILNEEHVDFEWLSLDDFIKKINWGFE